MIGKDSENFSIGKDSEDFRIGKDKGGLGD